MSHTVMHRLKTKMIRGVRGKLAIPSTDSHKFEDSRNCWSPMEILSMLGRSLQTPSPLTSAILRDRPKRPLNFCQQQSVEGLVKLLSRQGRKYLFQQLHAMHLEIKRSIRLHAMLSFTALPRSARLHHLHRSLPPSFRTTANLLKCINHLRLKAFVHRETSHLASTRSTCI
ncbi:hypothetical protein CIPAW_01G098700 [Carya illinoinensis]|uniref:Uncharacterized protein n=1 Tax=Carya illinoinensis TaxID=32201 RepID=A0A8T1RNJ4_CARIL|nr:hypothetical protein CIPAW_01G098700 [Carya illinoinensis]